MDHFVRTRKRCAVWTPWVLLFLIAAGGVVALFGQIPTATSGPVREFEVNQLERERILRELQPGIPADRVRQLLGRPNQLARQVLHLRHLEQWVYESPFPVRVEIEHARGRQPHLLTVQLLTSRKP